MHFMTDLYEEWWTQKNAIDEACRRGGHLLVTGLGLGMIVEAIVKDAPKATLDDGAHTARRVAAIPEENLVQTLRETDHGKRLVALGF